MKTIIAVLVFCTGAWASNPCSSIQVGNSVWGPNGQGYVSWGGFVPGAANSMFRQNISGASVHPSSSTWLTHTAAGTGGIFMQDPISNTDINGYTWQGRAVHYVHGDTQPRMPVGAITREGPGAGDPGTIPAIYSPRIDAQWGPYARPTGTRLSSGYSPEADDSLVIVDVDNCIEYDGWGCKDTGSLILCNTYGAYYLPGGDHQRPWNQPSVTNTLNVAGVPQLFGRVGWDEYQAALDGTPIPHAIAITTTSDVGQSGSWTGPAGMNQYASGTYNPNILPFGATLGLDSSFDVTTLSANCRPLAQAAKDHGLINIDGGTAPNTSAQENGNHWDHNCVIELYDALVGFGNPYLISKFHVIVPPQNNHIYCAYTSDAGCETLPTGDHPVIGTFRINGSTSATVTLSSTRQTLPLTWTGITGVTDFQGNTIPMRNVSWGPALNTVNRFGPGWINSDLKGEGVNVTVCSDSAAAPCDFMVTGTYTLQLMVQNRFGRTTADVTLTVN